MNAFSGMKLFFFEIEIRDGEHEYTYLHAVRSRSVAAAEKRAKNYAKTFLGSRMKWVDNSDLEPVGRDGEYRIVRMDGVSETTPEELLQRLLI